MGAPIAPESPAASTIRPTTPASSAPYSTTAFSVSISASGVPTETLSPGATSQVAMAASDAPASTLGIRTTDDKYGIAVYANNLFNSAYQTFGNSNAGNSTQLNWGLPRIIGVELSAKF